MLSNPRVRPSRSQRILHKTSRGNDVGAIATHRFSFRRASLVLPFVLTLAVASAMYYFRFNIALGLWSAIQSSVLGTMLFAIVLTIGVCGSLACTVIWWACRQELRINLSHRAAMRQHLATRSVQSTNPDQCRAA